MMIFLQQDPPDVVEYDDREPVLIHNHVSPTNI